MINIFEKLVQGFDETDYWTVHAHNQTRNTNRRSRTTDIPTVGVSTAAGAAAAAAAAVLLTADHTCIIYSMKTVTIVAMQHYSKSMAEDATLN